MHLSHSLKGLLCLLLGVKEDTHGGNRGVLLEGIDEELLALGMEGLDLIDINQTIPMTDIVGREFHIVAPDISESSHS